MIAAKPQWGNAARLEVPVAIVLALVALGYEGSLALRQSPIRNAHLRSFDQVVAFLHREAADSASLANPEPGSLGYLLGPNYRVIDTLGLTSPGVAQHILEGDRYWVYHYYRPDWDLESYGVLGADTKSEWFATGYQERAKFDEPYWTRQGVTLRLYQRVGP